MRRIKLILAALSVAVASFAAFSGPVLADELDCRDARGDLIRCDGDLYSPYYLSPYAFYGYDSEEYFDYLEDELDELEDLYEDYGHYYHYDW